MPDLEIRRLTSRTRPREVPPSAVEERVVYLDADGRPVDREGATSLVATFYDRAGDPVYTLRGSVG